jgi:hypothetical protein
MLAFNNWTNVVCLVSINPTYGSRSLSSGLNISTWTTSIIVTYLDQEEKVSTFRLFSFFSYEMTEHRRMGESLWKERKTTDCHSSHRCRRPRRLRFVSHLFSLPFLVDIHHVTCRYMNEYEKEWIIFSSFDHIYIIVIDCVNINASSESISLFVWREDEEEVTEKRLLSAILSRYI